MKYAPLLLLLVLCVATAAMPQATETAATPSPTIDYNQLELLIQSHKGRVLVVNFWATWCSPCLKEIPELRELRAIYPESALALIAVSLDFDPQALAVYLGKTPLPFPNYLADQTLMERKNLRAIPLTLVYDAQGKEVLAHAGRLQAEGLNPLIKKLIPLP